MLAGDPELERSASAGLRQLTAQLERAEGDAGGLRTLLERDEAIPPQQQLTDIAAMIEVARDAGERKLPAAIVYSVDLRLDGPTIQTYTMSEVKPVVAMGKFSALRGLLTYPLDLPRERLVA